MKHTKIAVATLALICTLSLAACGNTHTGQMNGKEPPSYGQSENQVGKENPGTSDRNNQDSTNLNDLLETSLLKGGVADFQNGSFQVVPDQDDGQTAIAAAPGMESNVESTTVSYGEDCIFQIAHIDSSTGRVELEEASASNIKKSTSVYVYGETQDNREIHATKVLIARFE